MENTRVSLQPPEQKRCKTVFIKYRVFNFKLHSTRLYIEEWRLTLNFFSSPNQIFVIHCLTHADRDEPLATASVKQGQCRSWNILIFKLCNFI